MAKRKVTNKYYFSVEGETEQWYLKWLEGQINQSTDSRYQVSIDCQVQKDPLKRVKRMVVTGKTEIWHLSDYESNELAHVKQFTETMDRMKQARQAGKQISYQFGYSNLTFDLWMILHKIDFHTSISHRKNYLTPLNRAYQTHFESMAEYKEEKNFKTCLNQLALANVVAAIDRAKKIMDCNHKAGYVLQQYKGYQYYKENPSLAVWEIIEKIMQDCELIEK